jgi:hypothetical protein
MLKGSLIHMRAATVPLEEEQWHPVLPLDFITRYDRVWDSILP